MNVSRIVENEHLPLWVVAAFVLAMLALVTALVAVHRVNLVLATTQAEVMFLNKKMMAPASTAPALAPLAKIAK